MSGKPWMSKIDPYGRRHLDEGIPDTGLEITVRVARDNPAARVAGLRQAGLEVQFTMDDVIVGRVADATCLARLASLPFVQEVQVSRPLRAEAEDRPPDSEG